VVCLWTLPKDQIPTGVDLLLRNLQVRTKKKGKSEPDRDSWLACLGLPSVRADTAVEACRLEQCQYQPGTGYFSLLTHDHIGIGRTLDTTQPLQYLLWVQLQVDPWKGVLTREQLVDKGRIWLAWVALRLGLFIPIDHPPVWLKTVFIDKQVKVPGPIPLDARPFLPAVKTAWVGYGDRTTLRAVPDTAPSQWRFQKKGDGLYLLQCDGAPIATSWDRLPAHIPPNDSLKDWFDRHPGIRRQDCYVAILGDKTLSF
jgi:hypothetical protein